MVNLMLGLAEHENGYFVFIMIKLVIIRLIDVKRPQIVGILHLVSLVNPCLIAVEHVEGFFLFRIRACRAFKQL